MTASPRTAALSVMAVYWLLLIAGMATCIAIRTDASIAAIWTGTVAGTALGHALALFNTRSWFALLSILTIAAVVGPSAPGELSGSTLWLAFIPAAACAYWSLGDRTSLVAFWFPAVIWMLSILDRAQANGIPDNTGIALLGGLALLFLVFLRVRESRRVALWVTVPAPATTLAQVKPPVMLRERPGVAVARTGWALLASALAFGATAWVAPQLWRSESLPGEHEIVATDPVAFGLPCCPVETHVDVPKARVKEYFSIGRGHDDEPIVQAPSSSCQRCAAPGVGIAKTGSITGPETIVTGPAPSPVGGRPYLHSPDPGYPDPRGYTVTRPAGDPWATSSIDWGGDPIANAPAVGAQPSMPSTTASTTYAPPPPPPAPEPIETPAPPIETAPTLSREQAIEALPAPVVAGSLPPPIAPPPSAPDPAAVVAPAPPPSPPPSHAATTSTDLPLPQPQHVAPRSSPTIGPSLLQWIGVILAAALLMQLAALALRPLRRLVTLRHLRKPYWEETVDQRVSNAWQLALVGLRDAGWRSDAHESPRELANRVGIAGVERCASILERARHGIGIDADDLQTINASAESAYRDARSRLGPVARAVSWLRWPLT